jgi:hypothetical protein
MDAAPLPPENRLLQSDAPIFFPINSDIEDQYLY